MCHGALCAHLHKGSKINEKSHSEEWRNAIIQMAYFLYFKKGLAKTLLLICNRQTNNAE